MGLLRFDELVHVSKHPRQIRRYRARITVVLARFASPGLGK
jgi:hypothetical protein